MANNATSVLAMQIWPVKAIPFQQSTEKKQSAKATGS